MQDLNKSLFEIESYLEEVENKDFPLLNITILRNITLEAIEPYLKYLSSKMGYKLNLNVGEYNNALQDIMNNNPILNQNTDCIMIFLKIETLSPNLMYRFTELEKNEIEEEIELVKSYIKMTLSGIRKKINAMINWHGFELPLYPAFGIIDYKNSQMQTAIIEELNNFAKKMVCEYDNCFYIDLNNIRARLGEKFFYDNRYWHIGKAPYTLDALKEISIDNFKLIRALKGKNKKCLVLDCDNTLWGGVIGEDGIAGIKLGLNYPGSPFYEFQQEILSLYHRGVIIALCSKNNENDVWEVLDNHPNMLIKREHVSVAQINWQDKATNIQLIAKELNIGLESIVFVDDSEFEINLINELLPNVQTIHLLKNKTSEYRKIIASCGYFDTLSFTNEDKFRGAKYKEESVRKDFFLEFDGDISSYLKSLEMVLEIENVNNYTIPRIAQLTQKTNQFNLTTKRYSESDIKKFVEDSNYIILSANLKDRFGDLGVIGCIILKILDKTAEIDTFLLSCRAIGRGVESILLKTGIEAIKKRNILEVRGKYIKTLKNSQVKDFYLEQGFTLMETDENQKKYCYDLDNIFMKKKSIFKDIKINY